MIKTIFEAVALVVIVVILFLQTWRASIVPIVAIPVSLIGTFTVLAAMGYSLNTLSLFGLVLAIGIVVDDAIVVVENVERNLRAGMSPREASHRTMDEVGGALIAIALVLTAVFIPAAFVPGISGQFFRQFAVTIAAATVISCFVSLTLSPALCALLFKPHDHEAHKKSGLLMRPVHAFFNGFNRVFDGLASGYGGMTRRFVRLPLIVLSVYGLLLLATGWQFNRAPTGFIPQPGPGLPDHGDPASARLIAVPHRRGGARSDQDHPGNRGHRPRRAVRGLRRRHLHQRVQCRRDLLRHGAVRGTAGARPDRRPSPARSDRPAEQHQGRLHHHDPAAARTWHRQFRRLQDDGPGQARTRR